MKPVTATLAQIQVAYILCFAEPIPSDLPFKDGLRRCAERIGVPALRIMLRAAQEEIISDRSPVNDFYHRRPYSEIAAQVALKLLPDEQYVDLTDTHSLAMQAMALMEEVPHDSFGPTDAVRALPVWEKLTEAKRAAVHKRLNNIIKGF